VVREWVESGKRVGIDWEVRGKSEGRAWEESG
jgi:hypothetical protein